MPNDKQDIVLACLTSSSRDASILRMAQRHARARDLSWCAVYLELWEDQKETKTYTRNSILEQVALAERMGATTFVTKAADYNRAFNDALSECERRFYNPTLIVAGGAGLGASATIRRAVGILEEICAHHKKELVLVTAHEHGRRRTGLMERLHMRRLTLKATLFALLGAGCAFMVNALFQHALSDVMGGLAHVHAYLIYLIGVAIVAGRYGLMPGMISLVTSFVLIDWFTIEPYYSFKLNNLNDVVSALLFLTAGSVISLVNSQVHAEAESSEINEWRMQALLQVYKIALHARTRHEALAELHSNLQQFLHAETAVYMPSLVSPTLQAVYPENPTLSEQDLEILNRTWEEVRNGQDVEDHNPKTGWRFEPLSTATGELGMLALRVPASEAIDTHFNQYLRMVSELVGSILEKIESTDMKEESRVRDEREKLRTSLLSSVSHDLKTPLAAILGSLSVHRTMYEKLPEMQRRELTDAALTEAQRLDSFITNILDLAKIESGAVKFKRQWQSPEDLINRVKKRMRLRFENHTLLVQAPASAVEIEIDPVISEQALFNVFDNAIKYTPVGSIIEVRMETSDDYFKIEVRDHGKGIPEDEHERIFDKYTRLQRQDHQVAGTGLGLALARAAMRGQGGDITVRNHEKGGAVFSLCWPQWRVASATGVSAA